MGEFVFIPARRSAPRGCGRLIIIMPVGHGCHYFWSHDCIHPACFPQFLTQDDNEASVLQKLLRFWPRAKTFVSRSQVILTEGCKYSTHTGSQPPYRDLKIQTLSDQNTMGGVETSVHSTIHHVFAHSQPKKDQTGGAQKTQVTPHKQRVLLFLGCRKQPETSPAQLRDKPAPSLCYGFSLCGSIMH